MSEHTPEELAAEDREIENLRVETALLGRQMSRWDIRTVLQAQKARAAALAAPVEQETPRQRRPEQHYPKFGDATVCRCGQPADHPVAYCTCLDAGQSGVKCPIHAAP